jgi:hypothetical protein
LVKVTKCQDSEMCAYKFSKRGEINKKIYFTFFNNPNFYPGKNIASYFMNVIIHLDLQCIADINIITVNLLQKIIRLRHANDIFGYFEKISRDTYIEFYIKYKT